jgi:hypothetical protein
VELRASGNASGTLKLTHPAADSAKVNAQWSQIPTPPKRTAATVSTDAIVAQKRAELAQQVQAKHLAAFEQIKARLTPQVQQAVSNRLSARKASADLVPAMHPLVQLVPLNASPTQVLNATAAPTLSSASVQAGDPGTPVHLQGQGFGADPSEVHFIVANGKDLTAPITYWADGEVQTEVPYLDGVGPFDGRVYVKRKDGTNSPSLPFHFEPPLDVAVLGIPPKQSNDYMRPDYDDSRVSTQADSYLDLDNIFHGTSFLPFWDDDHFYLTKTLNNGWKVASCRLINSSGEDSPDTRNGTVDITYCPVGSASTHLIVHWQIDANFLGGNYVGYIPNIFITGPKGLPYQ